MRKIIIIIVGIIFIAIAAAVMVWLAILTKEKSNVSRPIPVDAGSQQANITITAPLNDVIVNLPFAIQGQARVFESTLAVRVKDADGAVLFSKTGVTAAAPDAGRFGRWSVTADHFEKTPKGNKLTIEAYSLSPKDGSEINLVSIPVHYLQ